MGDPQPSAAERVVGNLFNCNYERVVAKCRGMARNPGVTDYETVRRFELTR
jgi:hypothetical protein